MKYPTTYFIAVAAFLLFVACLPTGIPLDTKEYVAALVACSGAFLLGAGDAHGIRAVAATGIYFLLGLLLPRSIEGISHGKVDMFSAYAGAMYVCLAACAVLFGLGRLGRFVVTKYALKR